MRPICPVETAVLLTGLADTRLIRGTVAVGSAFDGVSIDVLFVGAIFRIGWIRHGYNLVVVHIGLTANIQGICRRRRTAIYAEVVVKPVTTAEPDAKARVASRRLDRKQRIARAGVAGCADRHTGRLVVTVPYLVLRATRAVEQKHVVADIDIAP